MKPAEQSILFADAPQKTEELKKNLKEGWSTLLWLLLRECADEVQTVDAGRMGLVKLEVGKALKAWYMRQRGKVGHNKLFPSDRRVLLTHWVGEAVAKVDSDELYRRRLFERIGLL